MPELPEVESIRLGLLNHIVGQKILHIEILSPKLVSSSGTKRSIDIEKQEEFIRQIEGKKIIDIQRRAKNLIIELSSHKIILIHLKMTGQLVYQESGTIKALGGHPIQESEETLPNKHSHIIFTLEKGMLFYNDVRMFGYILYYPHKTDAEYLRHFDALGKEPLSQDFTSQYLAISLQNKASILKKVLLEQKIVVGLGNIYVDEVCFMAKIRPDRVANSLSKSEVNRLHTAITTILYNAISVGGSSVANYILADGSRGTYAREHKVYGRKGKKCYICHNSLKSIKITGRTTVYCEHCQI